MRHLIKHRLITSEVYADQYNGHIYPLQKGGDRLKETTDDANGFHYVTVDGLRHNVSYLCAKAFFPDTFDFCVGHKDNDRSNNRKSNLYCYGTKEIEETEMKKQIHNYIRNSKLVISNATTGEIIAEFKTSQQAADFLGTNRNTINQRVHNKRVIDNIRLERVPCDDYDEPTMIDEGDSTDYEPSMLIETEAEESAIFSDLEKHIVKTHKGRAVIMLDPETEEPIKEFESTTEAAKYLDKPSPWRIIQTCNGLTKTAYGYKWRYKEDKVSNSQLSARRNNRKVNQYDKETGDLLKTWDSMMQASQELGILKGAIQNNVMGRSRSSGGYVWRYADEAEETTIKEEPKQEVEIVEEVPVVEEVKEDPTPCEPIQQEPTKEKKKRHHTRPVVQCDRFTGKKVAEFKSISEASRALGCDDATIWDVLKGRYQNAKGFKWIYKEDYQEPIKQNLKELTVEDFKDKSVEDLAPCKPAPKRPKTPDRNDYRLMEVDNYRKRKVAMIDRDTRRVLCTFEAISYAARCYNVAPVQIVNAIRHKRTLCGYYWNYA